MVHLAVFFLNSTKPHSESHLLPNRPPFTTTPRPSQVLLQRFSVTSPVSQREGHTPVIQPDLCKMTTQLTPVCTQVTQEHPKAAGSLPTHSSCHQGATEGCVGAGEGTSSVSPVPCRCAMSEDTDSRPSSGTRDVSTKPLLLPQPHWHLSSCDPAPSQPPTNSLPLHSLPCAQPCALST